MLKACKNINFIGSIEARDIPKGEADVIVTEAFVGNVILKLEEGLASTLIQIIKEGMMSTTRSKLGGLLVKPALKETLKTFDATEYGGAPLLGLKGLVVKIHGSAKAKETKKAISEHCVHDIDIQIIVSDGLSSSSIEANAPKILPIVMEGLKEKGISTGTPIFVKFGRVAAQDQISELLNAKIVCSFIGERPGLATAESMSAYISYMATVGMPEARRTVVSNIHKNGVPAVEAGAYIVDLLTLILEKKASGVDLKK